LSGGGVGAEGMQVNLATDRHPRTNTERSQSGSLENGGVRRAGSQVLPDFEVISCPWRAASADQGSLSWSLLGKRPRNFPVQLSCELKFCCLRRFYCFSKKLLFRDSNRKISLSLAYKRPRWRPWSVEAALPGQLITSKSGRTWLPAAALLTPILKGATLTDCLYCQIYCAHLGTHWNANLGTLRAVSNSESRYSRAVGFFERLLSWTPMWRWQSTRFLVERLLLSRTDCEGG